MTPLPPAASALSPLISETISCPRARRRLLNHPLGRAIGGVAESVTDTRRHNSIAVAAGRGVVVAGLITDTARQSVSRH
jgi:hypothetical protein